MNSSSIERRQLVSFGLVMAAAALFLAWLFDLMVLAYVGAAFLIVAIAAPRFLTAVYRPWMRLAEILAWINTRIVLALIYYLVITPIGLVLRLMRRSPLGLREQDGSFWSAPPRHSWGDKHFEKQF